MRILHQFWKRSYGIRGRPTSIFEPWKGTIPTIDRMVAPAVSHRNFTCSNRQPLVSPTEADVTELFHRMNSRAESVISQDATRLAKYNEDWTKHYIGTSSIVVRPETTEEVSKILQYCHEQCIGIVPQGGNTGLVGGSVGLASPQAEEIVLSMDCMNQITGLDIDSGILKAQTGCILQDLQDYAAAQDYLVPVDLGAKGTCQIGGNLSTNAGGSYYYRYGSLHANSMGLEVVLPDGSILNLGYDPCLLKDNTGYDLKHVFIGAEGTLGVITAVALLCPRLPRSKCAAFLACTSFEEVCHTLALAKSELGEVLAAFEFMDQTIMELVIETHDVSMPLEDIPTYTILVETHGSDEQHDHEKLQQFVETAFVDGLVQDGAIAQNLGQVEEFWKIRESCNPSVAAKGYCYKYDVSLPVAQFADFIEDVEKGLEETSFGEDIVCTNWGHVIDGNLHLNLVLPGKMERNDDLYHCIEDLVLEGILSRDGSISAEHGLGQYKHKHMTKIKDATTLQTMRQVKELFDPHGIMNPGKYLPNEE